MCQIHIAYGLQRDKHSPTWCLFHMNYNSQTTSYISVGPASNVDVASSWIIKFGSFKQKDPAKCIMGQTNGRHSDVAN